MSGEPAIKHLHRCRKKQDTGLTETLEFDGHKACERDRFGQRQLPLVGIKNILIELINVEKNDDKLSTMQRLRLASQKLPLICFLFRPLRHQQHKLLRRRHQKLSQKQKW